MELHCHWLSRLPPPSKLALLKQNNPRLAEALESGKLEEFAKVLKEQQQARAEREAQRLRMLTADPMDAEAQRLIAQEIENKNIEQVGQHFVGSKSTRIMVSKGMVSKSKYWISEKNKGIPVSIFTESVLTFFQLCFIRVWSLRASTGFPKK